ncbi:MULTISPECIES: LytR/AlgR family response regulator transcription factor [Lacticaseibacillus]|uniref:LytR/AlgR family response regulator transcription factor n=1 Tax=Lacticaseibacillus TaxID=2759736 RepID=UPI00069B596D|nr:MULTISPECIES: LytTR family DNA-binding domain-containing protein [Lacticaseibacillus]
MLNIYILEDNPAYLKTLSHELKSFIMIEDLSASIKLATASPEALLQTIKPAAEKDSLYLLDIGIDNSDFSGVDVATAIRNASLFTDIIFVTSHTEAALSILTHKIAPLDLIDKDAPIAEASNRLRRDIQQVLDRIENRKVRSHNQFNYSVNGQMFAVPLDDLLYIQTASGSPGNLEVHALNETATFRDNLNHIASLYPTLFRVHKSVLVNPDHIKQLDTTNHYLYMDNDAKLDVSFRKQKLLKKMLNHHHSK